MHSLPKKYPPSQYPGWPNTFENRLPYYLDTVEYSCQGRLVRARRHHLTDRPLDHVAGGYRRPITEFTKKSRLNLMAHMATVQFQHHKTIFLTLTYGKPQGDAETAKKHLRTFLKRVYRKFGNVGVVWRMEVQEKRLERLNEFSWHFHLFLFDLPFWKWSDILTAWRECSQDNSTTNIKVVLIRDHRKATNYVSKYLAKRRPGDLFSNLDTPPNLPGSSLPGRYWGIENRANIPWAELMTVILMVQKSFYDLKRAGRKVNPKCNRHGGQGFTLFCDDSAKWWRYLWSLVENECQRRITE